MNEGGCLCGAIRYGVDTVPTDVINCHCKFCQKATGGDRMVETLFPKNSLKVLKGVPKVYEHVSEGSGKSIYVNFCKNCGTKLFLTFDRFPENVGVYSGTFDDVDWFTRNPENTMFFFLKEAPIGTVLPAHYDVFYEHYWKSDGVQAEPQTFDKHTIVTRELKALGETFSKQENNQNQ